MTDQQLKEYLDKLCGRYNNSEFVDSDPISIPHLFDKQEDIEVSAFLISIISWGQRKMILRSGRSLVERMDMAPAQFIALASDDQINTAVRGFVHRTFNQDDLLYFIYALRRLIGKWGSLGCFFEQSYLRSLDLRVVLAEFRAQFFDIDVAQSTTVHLSSIARGSACKRLCMMLRWMVRHDNCGVDFGLWRAIPPSALYIPLDVHSARQGRALGLLTRRQDDWKAVEQLTESLRRFDPDDPIRYDFSLFGSGVFGVDGMG